MPTADVEPVAADARQQTSSIEVEQGATMRVKPLSTIGSLAPDELTYDVPGETQSLPSIRRVRDTSADNIQLPKARAKVTELPRKQQKDDTKGGAHRRAPLPLGTTEDDLKKTPEVAEQDYQASPLAGAHEKPFFPGKYDSTASRRKSQPPDGPLYAALLPANVTATPEQLIQLLLPDHENEEDARNALLTGKGLLGRALPAEKAVALRDRFGEQNIPVELVSNEHPVLSGEPIEIIGLELSEAACVCKSARGRFPLELQKAVMLNFAQMRLSPQSRSMRRCIEIVTGQEHGRYHIWERTLSLAQTRVNGEPLGGDVPIYSLFQALADKVLPETLTGAAKRALKNEEEIVSFPSYEVYENYVTYCILQRVGHRKTE